MNSAEKKLTLPAWTENQRWLGLLEKLNIFGGMDSLRFVVPPVALLDALTIAICLLVVNSAVMPKDIGWLTLQPSPYLLLPVLVGSRYGFLSGVLAGFLVNAIVLTRLVWLDSMLLANAISLHQYSLVRFIAVGGICGEIQHRFRKNELQLSTANDHLRRRLKKLDGNVSLLLETKADLERLLATRDSELSTLDAEIRRLSVSENDELYRNILLLLNHQCRVSDAAIYLLDLRRQLVRQAVIGNPHGLPERLRADEIEMAALALEQKEPVSIPEFWQRHSGTQPPYLVAVPLVDSKDSAIGVLLVTGMPFIAFNQRAIHGIQLTCRWAVRVIETRRDPAGLYRIVNGFESQKIYDPEFFRHSLSLAQQSYRLYHLPSAVVLFACPVQPASFQSCFEQAILASVRDGDCAADLHLPVPHVAVLLPLTGERGAHIFRERILCQCRERLKMKAAIDSRVLLFDRERGAEEIWNECITYPKANRRSR